MRKFQLHTERYCKIQKRWKKRLAIKFGQREIRGLAVVNPWICCKKAPLWINTYKIKTKQCGEHIKRQARKGKINPVNCVLRLFERSVPEAPCIVRDLEFSRKRYDKNVKSKYQSYNINCVRLFVVFLINGEKIAYLYKRFQTFLAYVHNSDKFYLFCKSK